jgi:hypothetical protein
LVPSKGTGSPGLGIWGRDQLIRPRPAHHVGQVLDDRTPRLGVPSLGRAHDRQIERHVGECRELLQPEGLDDLTVGVHEAHELLGVGAEELLCARFVAGQEEGGPHVRTGEVTQDPGPGLEQPRALVRVGIEDDQREVEQLELIGHGAILPAELVQDEVGGEGRHRAEKVAHGLLRDRLRPGTV